MLSYIQKANATTQIIYIYKIFTWQKLKNKKRIIYINREEIQNAKYKTKMLLKNWNKILCGKLEIVGKTNENFHLCKTKTKQKKYPKQTKCLNVLLLIFNCIKFMFSDIVVLSFHFIYKFIAVVTVDNTYKYCVLFSIYMFSSNYISIAFKFSFYFIKKKN